MFQYDFFYNNWVDIGNIFTKSVMFEQNNIPLKINLPEDFFENLKLDRDSLKKYRIDAAKQATSILGNNPALCLSGGIDSQAMILCFLEANISFKTYTLVFNDDLNIQDVLAAKDFSKKYNLNFSEIPINIKTFLNRENFEYGLRYKSASPHFNTHYKLFNILKEKGHTGICAGGDVAFYSIKYKNWGRNFRRNSLNFINYSEVENIPVIGNFLSFYPNLSWSISILTKDCLEPDFSYKTVDFLQSEENKLRYHDKINGYIRTGLNITPQPKKFTGFELVKIHYEHIYNDPLEFEKRFRMPLEEIICPINHGAYFDLSPKQLKDIENLKNFYSVENQFYNVIAQNLPF